MDDSFGKILIGFALTILAGIILLVIQYHTKWFERGKIKSPDIKESESLPESIPESFVNWAKTAWQLKTRKVKVITFCIASLVFVGLLIMFVYQMEWFDKSTEAPKIIQELATISDVNILKSELKQYQKLGILAIGEKENFGNPDGFFVFIVDEARVYGTFLFQDNTFLDLRTNTNLVNLPGQLSNKQQIWVIESYKLVQE